VSTEKLDAAHQALATVHRADTAARYAVRACQAARARRADPDELAVLDAAHEAAEDRAEEAAAAHQAAVKALPKADRDAYLTTADDAHTGAQEAAA
jgi:hypothetical protein